LKTIHDYEKQAKEYFDYLGEKVPTAGALTGRESKRNLDTIINSFIMIDVLNALTEKEAVVSKQTKK
jgi:hypothetical protein